MRLVYKFNNYQGNERLFQLCRISKDLYNQALYICIQVLNSDDKRFVSYNELDKQLKNTPSLNGTINYRLLKAQVAQQTLKLVSQNIGSFFKQIKDWKKHPEKYNGMPRPPKYLKKDGYYQLVYTNQCSTIRDGNLILSKNLTIAVPQWDKYADRLMNFQQVRINPKRGYTEIEIVYLTDGNTEPNLNKTRYASIDLGLGNFATMVTDYSEPIIYNGRQIKSHNQLCNKKLSNAKSILEKQNGKKTSRYVRNLTRKRNQRINDLMHKISKDIVNRLIANGVGNLICGRNKGWKDSINLGKATNQLFVGIPYERFIDMLRYKCEMCGIAFHETEESYTSKCDGLAMEGICKQEEYKGKRVKRGLFQSSTGRLVNADVNGALNIMRKVVGDSEYMARIIDRGLLFRPRRYDNLYRLQVNGNIPEQIY